MFFFLTIFSYLCQAQTNIPIYSILADPPSGETGYSNVIKELRLTSSISLSIYEGQGLPPDLADRAITKSFCEIHDRPINGR